jgi:hypothetical protein
MAIINRASLAEEFYDTTSARMLVQPEPQYVYAFLAKMSLGSALAVSLPGGFAGISAQRGVQSQGPSAAQYQAGARLMLASPDPMSTQSIATVAEIGKAPGHTVRLNRPKYGSGGFTLGSREITSGTQISVTPIDLSSEQVTLTLKRYGGPYDAVVQNAVAPFALDKFDTSVALHSLVDYVGLHMQRDFDKWLDSVYSLFFASGSTTLWPNGFTADSQSTAQNDMPCDGDMLFRGIETLKNANIPLFPNGRYRGFLSPTQARQIKEDPLVGTYFRYDVNGKNPITGSTAVGLGGSFIGTIPGCDFYESTTNQVAANGNGVNITTGVIVGPSMVGQGFGQLPQVQFSTDDNYGEHAKMVWLQYSAHGLLDNRFAVQLHTS